MLSGETQALRGQKVLVIDDDAYICRMMEMIFSHAGAKVACAADAAEGLQKLRTLHPNLIILDILMPKMNGWEAMRHIRSIGLVPTIMVSALNSDEAMARGLEAGAIDYVTKPFSPAVLLARARAALRLAAYSGNHGVPVAYDDGRLAINLLSRRIRVQGERVKLTKTEFRLLAYMLQNSGRLLTAEHLLEHVWHSEQLEDTPTVHTCIFRLRQKLEEDPRNPRYLLTEYGMGYRFEVEPASVEYSPAPSLS